MPSEPAASLPADSPAPGPIELQYGEDRPPAMRGWMIARYAGLAALVPLTMATVDVPVARWVHDHAFSDATQIALRLLRLPGYFAFTLVLAGCFWWRNRSGQRAAIVLLAAAVVASSITAVLKCATGRVRPFHGREAFDWQPLVHNVASWFTTPNMSFPSGDATLAFATAGVFAVVCPRWRWAGYAWAIIVGAVRVLQGAHYESDVTAGAFVGLLTAELMVRRFLVARDPGQSASTAQSPTAAAAKTELDKRVA